MKYFFDNNISPRIVCVLNCLEVDAVHLRDVFPPATADVSWLPELSGQDRILVTVDVHIRTRPPEVFALKQAEAAAVFLYRGFARIDLWDQVAWLLRRWREIEGVLGDAERGKCYRVPQRGHIREI